MWFTHKNDIVRGLVGRNNNIFVMEVRQAFSDILDVLRVLTDPLRFFYFLICSNDLALLTHSERMSFFSRLPNVWHSHRRNPVMFSVYGFTHTILRPFGEHISRIGVANTVKATSYIDVARQIIYKGELVQVQSGSLDLKSSLLRSCNTFLWLNSLVVIGVVEVCEIIGMDWCLKYGEFYIWLICDEGYCLS